MIIINFLLTCSVILFATQAILSKRLIVCALWLAGCSALLSIILYLMGAHLVAVVELSVGAGLVTVLFVFAISIAGEDTAELRSLVPKPLALVSVAFFVVLLSRFTLPTPEAMLPKDEPIFSILLWQGRALDIFVQIVLIFSGVLGLLGLLAEAKAPLKYPLADEVSARRERELEALQRSSLEKEITA